MRVEYFSVWLRRGRGFAPAELDKTKIQNGRAVTKKFDRRQTLGAALGAILCAGLIFLGWESMAQSGKSSGADISYDEARWHKIHNAPEIDKASDADCLQCHSEILSRKVRPSSPAGVKTADTLAWYQTLDTYEGDQQTFHWRHMSSPLAKKVMKLDCVFCHQGNDLREESPAYEAPATKAPFTLRKMVSPEETCLRCHGRFPYENMEGLEDTWSAVRGDWEDEDIPNGCYGCHDPEYGFRSNRHRVTYLNAEAIEEAAQSSSDVCYGCHGGRAWYRNSYPYPRNPWPDMPEETPEDTPEWARSRSTQSGARFRLPAE